MDTRSACEVGPFGTTPVEAAYILGPDRDGHWVAIEIHGLGGGLFRTKEAAEHYAAFETARRPGAVRLSDTSVEFRI